MNVHSTIEKGAYPKAPSLKKPRDVWFKNQGSSGFTIREDNLRGADAHLWDPCRKIVMKFQTGPQELYVPDNEVLNTALSPHNAWIISSEIRINEKDTLLVLYLTGETNQNIVANLVQRECLLVNELW